MSGPQLAVEERGHLMLPWSAEDGGVTLALWKCERCGAVAPDEYGRPAPPLPSCDCPACGPCSGRLT